MHIADGSLGLWQLLEQLIDDAALGTYSCFLIQ